MIALYNEFGHCCEHDCAKCTTYEDKLQDAAYWAASIRERITNQQWNTESIAWDIDELCHILGVETKKVTR